MVSPERCIEIYINVDSERFLPLTFQFTHTPIMLCYAMLRPTTAIKEVSLSDRPKDPRRLCPAHQRSSHTGSTKTEAPSDLLTLIMPLLLGEEQWLKTLRETETGAATYIAIEVAGRKNLWLKFGIGVY